MESRAMAHACRLLKESGAQSSPETDAGSAELFAYDAAFGLLEEQLTTLWRELFIATATGEGITLREELLRPVMAQTTLPNRREMLFRRFGMTPADCTLARLTEILPAAGIRGVIYEQEGELLVSVLECMGLTQQEVQRELAVLLPCHLPFTVDFTTMTWDAFDAMDADFSQLDSVDITFAQWDAFDGALI